MPHDGQSGGQEQRFHDNFVHAGCGTEYASPYVGNVSQLEQALNGAVLAKGTVQHGEDDVDVDSAVSSTAGEHG